jgi:hypothetical protein
VFLRLRLISELPAGRDVPRRDVRRRRFPRSRAGLTLLLVLLLGFASPTQGAGTPSSGSRVALSSSTGSNLTANGSYFDDGGSWNCEQGQETIYLFGNAVGGVAPYQFSWTFGDGSPSSPTQDPVHVYHTVGVFHANLTVTDAVGDHANSTVNPDWAVPLFCTGPSTPFGSLGLVGVTLYAGLIIGVIVAVVLIRRARRGRRPLPPL